MKRFISVVTAGVISTTLLLPVSAAGNFLSTSTPGALSVQDNVDASSTAASQIEVKQTEVKQTEVKQTEVKQAEAKITKEEAKKIAAQILKENFDISADEKSYNVMIDYRQEGSYYYSGMNYTNGGYAWNINYQAKPSSVGVGISSVFITIDAQTGTVIRINRFENNYNPGMQQQVAVYKQEQAVKIAEDFLNKLNPEKFKQTKRIENFMQDYINMGPKMPVYNFMYARQIDGIAFDNDAITISVDGVTGKITNYELRWNNNNAFPDKDGIVSKDKAYDKLKEQLDMKLSYIPFANNNYNMPPKTSTLVYSIEPNSNLIIDAKTGAPIKINQGIPEVLGKKDISEKEKSDFYAKFKPEQKSDKEIDSSKAEELMKKKLKELFNEDYDITSVSYQDNNYAFGSTNAKVWSAQFNKKGSESDFKRMSGSGSISIDATTGKMINVCNYDYTDMQGESEFVPKITWDEAYYKAIELIAANFPEKVKEIQTEQAHIKQIFFDKEAVTNGKPYPERMYSFNFPRLVNGIPCQDGMISVVINAKTGLINSLYMNWNDKMTFPDSAKVLNPDDAKKIFLKEQQIELAYVTVPDNTDKKQPANNIKLVYRISLANQYRGLNYIDAVTGKLVNFGGQNVGEHSNYEKFEETIKGHWAEKELGILGYQGIIDISSFSPNKEITKIDAIKMLVNAKGYMYYMGTNEQSLKFTDVTADTEEYKYLQMAVNYGIIENKAEEFQMNSKVKREEMAEMIVKLVKYDKIARVKEIFALPFEDAKDISPERYGYVAVGKGLGMFKGDNGKFRPNDNSLMGEMAAAIYSGLETIQSASK